MEAASGVLIVNKPSGMTSHDVVNRVRRIFQQRKVGHAGTLDPDATGVLVLCLGQATRLLEYLVADDKEYEAQIIFGTSTDTDDASGNVLSSSDASSLSEADIAGVLGSFTGTVLQKVPAYSSVHIQGKRAYELARSGQEFELPERQVTIHSLQLNEFFAGNPAVANVHAACSKGTYIRSLCRDIGEKLAVPAHMGKLVRTRSGTFSIEDATELADLAESKNPGQALLPVLSAITLPKVSVSKAEADQLAVGQRIWSIPVSDVNETQNVVAVLCKGELVAVSKIMDSQSGKWLLQPTKVFWKKDR